MTVSSITARSITVDSSNHSAGKATPTSTSGLATPETTASAAKASSPDRISQAISRVNDYFVQKEQNLFAFIEKDGTSGVKVVKIIEKGTERIVSQFPSKAIVAIAEMIDRSTEGTINLLHVKA